VEYPQIVGVAASTARPATSSGRATALAVLIGRASSRPAPARSVGHARRVYRDEQTALALLGILDDELALVS
jgi:hypothetical protein